MLTIQLYDRRTLDYKHYFLFRVGDRSQIYDRNHIFNVSVSHILLIISHIILCYGNTLVDASQSSLYSV